jgi:hypothetical protein
LVEYGSFDFISGASYLKEQSPIFPLQSLLIEFFNTDKGILKILALVSRLLFTLR